MGADGKREAGGRHREPRAAVSRFNDYPELVRAPTVLTVLGDRLVGRSAAGHVLSGRRMILPIASACLYASGMALYDYADRAIDARERRGRPIPSRPGG